MRTSWNDKNNIVLVMILILGFLFRVGGITHGLPFSYYPDEEHFLNRALSFGTGDLNPHWFHKPALYMYLLFFEYGLLFLFGKLIGLLGNIQDFARLYINDKTIFLLIGRATTTLFGMGMIFLTYWLGRKAFAKRVGLIAALVLVCTFAHVKSCQDIKADVPAGFLALVSFLFVIGISERGLRRDYLLAGLFAGLGTATKYSPFVLLIPLFAAHLIFLRSQGTFSWRKLINGNLLLGFVFLWVGFFIGSPFNFLDPFWLRANFYNILLQSTVTTDAATNFSLLGVLNLLWRPIAHAGWVILRTDSMGPVLGFLSLLGIPFLIFRGHGGGRLIVLMSLSFIYVSDFMLKSYSEARHLNIIYPFLGLGAAAFVNWVMEKISPSPVTVLKFRRQVFALALPILLVLPSAYRIVMYDYRVSQQDTRSIAKEWIEKNIPPGTKILVDNYCVPLKMSPRRAKELFVQAEREDKRGLFTAHAASYYRYYYQTVEEPTYDLLEISHPWWKNEEDQEGTFRLSSEFDRDFGNPVKEWGVLSLKEYRALGFQYLITTEQRMRSYLNGARGAGFRSFVRFYQDVKKQASLFRCFDPQLTKGPGPKVLVYQLLPEN